MSAGLVTNAEGTPAGTAGWIASSDAGGTFTDFVVWDGTMVHTDKRATDARDRQRVVVEGTVDLVLRAGGDMQGLARVVHGSTAATNAVLQRKGGRVALLTNAGFEDLVEIGRQHRPRLYDLTAVRTEPLAPRTLRWGVHGRMDPHGNELEPLDAPAVAQVAQQMQEAKVDAVAVCFLHSYADGRHEQQAAAILRSAGLPRISISSELSPEPREFERATTALVNAFLQPVFEDNLSRLEASVAAAGADAPVFVVESSGGMVSAAEAQRQPVRTILSGPAGGVAASAELAARLGMASVLTFDMGGTSTDMAVLADARPLVRNEIEVAGLPIRTPAIDMTTIGAGGGSIAHVDAGGILQVGPESAEAWPGPACYGRGGERATVTDADVQLGRLDADGFLAGDGEVTLRPEQATRALTALGREIELDADEAAAALLQVATTNLVRGIRRVTTQRGLDPAEHALVAFGGAGAMHGLDAAKEAGIRRVVVPMHPSVFSAWGMLVGDVRHAFSATVMQDTTDPAIASFVDVFGPLRDQALRRFADEGFHEDQVTLAYSVDLRYRGQSFELPVALGSATPAALAQSIQSFHAAHHRRYGHDDLDQPVEWVAARLEASASPSPRPTVPTIPSGGPCPPPAARIDEREVSLLGDRRRVVPVIDRKRLLAGNKLEGPAVIEGGDHTFILPAGARASVTRWGDVEVLL